MWVSLGKQVAEVTESCRYTTKVYDGSMYLCVCVCVLVVSDTLVILKQNSKTCFLEATITDKVNPCLQALMK